MEKLKFLTPELAEKIRTQFGSPCYVYDAATLKRQARQRPQGDSTPAAALAHPASHMGARAQPRRTRWPTHP